MFGWRKIPGQSSILSAVTLAALFCSQGFFWALMEAKVLFQMCLLSVREDKAKQEKEKERKAM